MGRGRIYKCIVFVEAPTLDFGTFFLLVQQLEILCQHHELSLRDDHEILEVMGGPYDLFDDGPFGQTDFME